MKQQLQKLQQHVVNGEIKDDIINKIINGQLKTIVFGCGRDCEYFFRILPELENSIEAIVDNDVTKCGSYYKNHVIKSPNILKDRNMNVIIIILKNKLSEIARIIRQLVNLNIPLNNIISMREVIHSFFDSKLYSVYNILHDIASKQIISKYVEIRNNGVNNYSSIRDNSMQQYFFNEIFTYSPNEVFVDAGACDGTTSLAFMKELENNFKRIYAFEPDPICFNLAFNNLKQKNSMKDKINLIQKGVSNVNGTLKFKNDLVGCSHINEDEGNIEIITTRLDDEISEKVTFIKMDIEGSELDGLVGAEKLIKKYKPKLSICIYHREEDIWTIPLYINQIEPNYKLYIRHHDNSAGELVLYAVC